eukprot:gene3728-8362_t
MTSKAYELVSPAVSVIILRFVEIEFVLLIITEQALLYTDRSSILGPGVRKLQPLYIRQDFSERLIAVLDPKDSWVARAQNLMGWAVPGCYAMSIVGSLSDEIVQELQEPIRKRYLAMKSKAQ